jgi:hypothetical protein
VPNYAEEARKLLDLTDVSRWKFLREKNGVKGYYQKLTASPFHMVMVRGEIGREGGREGRGRDLK